MLLDAKISDFGPYAMDLPPVEEIVWERLRNRRLDGLSFTRRQRIGDHTLDFYCEASRVAVALDGDSVGFESAAICALRRDLKCWGIDLVHFSCRDAYYDIGCVCATIIRRCTQVRQLTGPASCHRPGMGRRTHSRTLAMESGNGQAVQAMLDGR